MDAATPSDATSQSARARLHRSAPTHCGLQEPSRLFPARSSRAPRAAAAAAVTAPDARRHFGEGITRVGDRLLQLTWRSGTLLEYADVATFDDADAQNLTAGVTARDTGLSDGWGITYDGTHVIITDSTADLRWFEPDSLHEVRREVIRDGDAAVPWVNELEWVAGQVSCREVPLHTLKQRMRLATAVHHRKSGSVADAAPACGHLRVQEHCAGAATMSQSISSTLDSAAHVAVEAPFAHLRGARGLQLWGNVWQTNCVARIDAATARVTAWLELGALTAKTRRHNAAIGAPMDVLNGIAHDAQAGTFYATGKYWSRMYELKVTEAVAEASAEELAGVRQRCIPRIRGAGL